MAAQLGLELARGGALLISGIAQGIDSTALKGALKGGGPVVSVLAGGVDVPYPSQNRFLYEDVAAAGALISEYPPGTRHKAEHFPVRNRLISGLSLGVVAVECARFSGTMKTIEHAMDQDRDIFAVPGNIDAPRSEGPNWLLRQGARPVTCAQDILEEYWLRFPQKLARSAPLPPEAAQQRLEQLRSRKGPEGDRTGGGAGGGSRVCLTPGGRGFGPGACSPGGAALPLYRRPADSAPGHGGTEEAEHRGRAGGGDSDPGPPGALRPHHAPGGRSRPGAPREALLPSGGAGGVRGGRSSVPV